MPDNIFGQRPDGKDDQLAKEHRQPSGCEKIEREAAQRAKEQIAPHASGVRVKNEYG